MSAFANGKSYQSFDLTKKIIKYNLIEESNSGIGFNLKQLMTDDGFMRSVDLGVSYIDKEKNFIDFLKVNFKLTLHFIYLNLK